MKSQPSLTRRQLLSVGGATLLGVTLPELLRAESTSRIRPRAKSIIFLHQWGGPSQYDTIDMKPNAPKEIRGELKPVATKVPGLQVCERLPRLAKVMHHCTVIRTLQHEMKNHNSAGYYSLTGMSPSRDDQRLRDSRDLFPAYGSIIDKLAPAKKGIPTFVSFPYVIRDGSITPGQHASFLGKSHDPLFTAQDPNEPSFRIPELSLPSSLSAKRLSHRREVLKIIDQQSKLLEHSEKAQDVDASFQRALTMLTAPGIKKAFDLSQESQKIREKYGRTTFGQSCLLARRLVEAGAKFINVYFSSKIGGCTGGWDTHGFRGKPMYPILKKYLLPITDQVLPTLIEDLSDRGLLDETLIVWVGEFGRTPRMNDKAGRDHWPRCYPALLAGAGVKAGHVFGQSDKIGAYPAKNPVRPEDLSATMFQVLGIDPKTEIHDALNRPLPISPGSPITDVLA